MVPVSTPKESYLFFGGADSGKENPKLLLTTDYCLDFRESREEDFEDTLDVVRKVRYDTTDRRRRDKQVRIMGR